MTNDELPRTAADPVGLRQLAGILGLGYDAARVRLVANQWPHIRRGPNGKGGYRFLPEHVEAIRRIETRTGGAVKGPSKAGRTERSRKRAA